MFLILLPFIAFAKVLDDVHSFFLANDFENIVHALTPIQDESACHRGLQEFFVSWDFEASFSIFISILKNHGADYCHAFAYGLSVAYASQIPSSLHELSQALEMEWCDLGDLAREVADFSDPQKQLFLMKGFDYHGDFDGGLEFADTFAGEWRGKFEDDVWYHWYLTMKYQVRSGDFEPALKTLNWLFMVCDSEDQWKKLVEMVWSCEIFGISNDILPWDRLSDYLQDDYIEDHYTWKVNFMNGDEVEESAPIVFRKLCVSDLEFEPSSYFFVEVYTIWSINCNLEELYLRLVRENPRLLKTLKYLLPVSSESTEQFSEGPTYM